MITSASWLPASPKRGAIGCTLQPIWAGIPEAPLGVRVKQHETGGDHGGTAVGGSAKIGARGTARLVRDRGPRSNCADLHLQGFQRSVRLHVPRRPGGRKERPSPGMEERLQDGGSGAGDA